MKYLLLCLTLSAFGSVRADSAADGNPLFQSDEIMTAVLTAPITQAYAQKLQDVRIYLPGYWTYVDSDELNQRLDVSIRVRGNFRREHCSLPPLQLNLKKSQVKGTVFAGQNKLKLVAPCQSGSSYQQKVILEYLAYKTLQILTDYSFRTRLVRISYVDSDQKKKSWTSLAFMIEDDGDVADRLGVEKLHVPEVEFYELDQSRTAVAELFQLLIANGDYSVLQGPDDEDCCHNSEMMSQIGAQRGYIPIPFDFDMSGLVNARYAAPPKTTPIHSVRTRYYKGLCQPPEVLSQAIADIRSKRDEIVALFANMSELDSKTKKSTLEYVEDFFEILDSPKRVDREIIKRCRGQDHLDAMQ